MVKVGVEYFFGKLHFIYFINMKPKDPVRSKFEVLENDNSKEQKAKCLNCNAMMSARAPRLKRHVQKCGNFDSSAYSNVIFVK